MSEYIIWTAPREINKMIRRPGSSNRYPGCVPCRNMISRPTSIHPLHVIKSSCNSEGKQNSDFWLSKSDYINNTLLTQESYPEVRLMASYPFRYFGATSSSPKEPLFLCFSGPEGAQPADFNSMWAHYLDMENMIVYDYQLV